MDIKKTLLLTGLAALIAVGVAVVAVKRPQDAAQAPLPETSAPAAAPVSSAPEAAPAEPAAPAASDAPACTQYNWDGTAWVCTSSAAVPGTAGSN